MHDTVECFPEFMTGISNISGRSKTEKGGECARAVAAHGTLVQAVSPAMGPASIESHYDEALAVPGLLDAARELARGPVVGIAEAAMQTASFLGRRFTVVTTLGRTRGRAWELAHRYGMNSFCRNVRACEIPVLEMDVPGSPAREKIIDECRRAVEEDGAVMATSTRSEYCAPLPKQYGGLLSDFTV